MVSAQRSEFRQVVAREGVDLLVDPRIIRAALAVQPDFGVAGEVGACGLQRFEHLGRDHDVQWLDDIDAVGERHPGEVGVEQRHHAADVGDAEPKRQEFRPVRHHQADGIALADALRQRPAGVTVGARGQFAVAEALAVGEERRRVAVLVGKLDDDLWKDARRMPGDRRRHPQGAQGSPERGRVGGQTLDQSHDSSRPD